MSERDPASPSGGDPPLPGTEATTRQQLQTLYLLQAHYDGPCSEAGRAAPAAQQIAAAAAAGSCTAADLLAAGYAVRRWAQHRSLEEQAAWPRATACPHYTLLTGLAGAACAGSAAARDWYSLAVVLRRVTLSGASRTPVVNDYVIEWLEEHLDYLA